MQLAIRFVLMEPAFFKTHFAKLKNLIIAKTGKFSKIVQINFPLSLFFMKMDFQLKNDENQMPGRKCGHSGAASKIYDCIQAKRSIHCIFNHRRVQIEWKNLRNLIKHFLKFIIKRKL